MQKKFGIARSSLGRFLEIAIPGDEFIVFSSSYQNCLSTARYYGKKIKTEKLIFVDPRSVSVKEAYKITLLSGKNE